MSSPVWTVTGYYYEHARAIWRRKHPKFRKIGPSPGEFAISVCGPLSVAEMDRAVLDGRPDIGRVVMPEREWVMSAVRRPCLWCGLFVAADTPPWTFLNLFGHPVTQLHCPDCRESGNRGAPARLRLSSRESVEGARPSRCGTMDLAALPTVLEPALCLWVGAGVTMQMVMPLSRASVGASPG